jgi:hypothetical protein
VDPAVVAALIAAPIAILGAAISAYLTIWSTQRQRATDLVVAALSHMGGGSQERSAGVAALLAMRGPLDRPLGHFDRSGWAIYGPAVGQQLFRQLIYVLRCGKQNTAAHEVENLIVMIDWLLNDDTLRFDDAGQRNRLGVSMEAYKQSAPALAAEPSPSAGLPGVAPERSDRKDRSIEELLSRMDEWIPMLTHREGVITATGRERRNN